MILMKEIPDRFWACSVPLTWQEIMECGNLEEYKKIASEQAKPAVIHFKDDFMFKIRSAIRDAHQRKDELNRIISRLDFGKDKYQFVIGKKLWEAEMV